MRAYAVAPRAIAAIAVGRLPPCRQEGRGGTRARLSPTRRDSGAAAAERGDRAPSQARRACGGDAPASDRRESGDEAGDDRPGARG